MAQLSLLDQLKKSLFASIGDIVFGMEDGTVSIFGLVAGVAVGATSSREVLMAGATGAIAAAVSMMAGIFLDIQSEQDAAQVEAKQRELQLQANPEQAIEAVMTRLAGIGFGPSTLNSIRSELQQQPERLLALQAVSQGTCRADAQNPLGHALWMLVSDLFAGLTPVLAFAFLPLHSARWVSLGMTLTLLLLLGYGRARIGQRPLWQTMAQTVSIAAAAAVAGVVIEEAISRFF
jgi:VIT1/CCC1 family predicted Fe2+/Mn2+ transporter